MNKYISLEAWRSNNNPNRSQGGNRVGGGMITVNRSPHGNKKHRDQFVSSRGGVYKHAKGSDFGSSLNISEFSLKSNSLNIDQSMVSVQSHKSRQYRKYLKSFNKLNHCSEMQVVYRSLKERSDNYTVNCSRKKLSIRHRVVIR